MLYENVPEEAGLGSAGAFIDTTGERGRKRKKIPVKVAGDFADREEEELEALVFGRQLFKPRESSEESESETGDGSEEEEGVRGGRKEGEPAWRDEDDDELRSVSQ